MSDKLENPNTEPYPRGDDLTDLRHLVRSFVDREVIPLESKYRGLKRYPDEIQHHLEAKTKEMGLWAVGEPTETGGAGLGVLAEIIVVEEYARSVAHSIRGGHIFGPRAGNLERCLGPQREKYLEPVLRGQKSGAFALTEPDSGSDVVGRMRTRAIRKDDKWLLSGSKIFISGADTADFFQVFALTDAKQSRRESITCFLVDRDLPGVTVSREIKLMIPDTVYEISFSDVSLDDSAVLGEVGQGMGFALGWLGTNRLRHSAQCVGRASRALEIAIDFVKNRVTFGRPLSERQAIQFMIADCALDLSAARKAIYAACDAIDSGRNPGPAVSVAKLLANEGCFRVADRCLQMLGAMGLTTEVPVEQIFRELRSMRITEGTTEIHRWRISRSILVDDDLDQVTGSLF